MSTPDVNLETPPTPNGSDRGRTKDPSRAAGTVLLAEPMVRPSLSPYLVWGLLAGAFALVLALQLTVWSVNAVTLTILTSALYGVVIYVVSAVREGRRNATDRLVTVVVTTFFALAIIPLASVLLEVVTEGYKRFDIEFFTYSMRGVVGEGGGAYAAIMGTLIITGVTTLMSVPVGIMAAIYLVEYGAGKKLARGLTFFVDVMTGIPSIVAGLFAVSLFVLILGPGARAGIIGAVALSVLMIPVVVRATEEMLRLVPNELREASYALGVSKWRTVTKVVIRTSIAGIVTGVTLAVARVIGETAPLLVTVGLTTSTNLNPFEGRMATLPVFSYYEYAQPGVPQAPYFERAWAAALTLIIIVMALNLIARVISRVYAPKTGR
jgi:phosphate transport system permease protein